MGQIKEARSQTLWLRSAITAVGLSDRQIIIRVAIAIQ
jgi:hypothetical protein